MEKVGIEDPMIEKEMGEHHKDILFFDPPIHTDQELAYSLLKDADQNMDLPRGMLSIASHLKDNQISSEVVSMDSYLYAQRALFVDEGGDFDQEKFLQAAFDLIDRQVEESDPPALAFGLMYTFTEPTVLAMTGFVKAKYPEKKVIVGGNHATFTDTYLLDPESKTGIDIVVRFEGEETTRELVDELRSDNADLSKIKGISWRDDEGQIHQNPPRDRQDLYQLPPLDYSLVRSGEGLEKFNHTAMLVRGCMGNCAFCTSPRYWKRETAQGPAENFQQEVEYLVDNGVEAVAVLDDDILASEDAFNAIVASLKEVKARNPEVQFIAQTRISHFRDEEKIAGQLAQMKEAGISRLYVGIESGSQEILNEMRKGYKTEMVEPACRLINEAGIQAGGFWLFGHPGATREEEENSLAFMEDLLQKGLLQDVEAHAVVPFPGTEVARDPRVRIIDHDKKHYGFLNNYPVYDLINPETGEVTLSAEEIKGFLDRALEIRQKYLGVEAQKANADL